MQRVESQLLVRRIKLSKGIAVWCVYRIMRRERNVERYLDVAIFSIESVLIRYISPRPLRLIWTMMLMYFCSGLLRDGMHVLYVEVLVLRQKKPKNLRPVLRQHRKKSRPPHRTWQSRLSRSAHLSMTRSSTLLHKTLTLYHLIGYNTFA